MGNYAVFTLLWTNLAQTVDTGGAPIIAGLMAKVGPWFKLCVPAYLVMILLIATWTSDDGAMMLFFRSLFLASILYALSTNAVTFDHYVTQLVHGIVHGLTTAIAGGVQAGAHDANAYDILGTRGFSIGLAVFKNLPTFSWKAIPLGIGIVIYWFLSFAAVVELFSIDLVSYVLSDLFIDIAPIFIPCYFAPYTRTWFNNWLSILMTTVFSQILNAAVGALFIFTMGTIFDQAAKGLTGAALATVDGGVVVGEMMMLVVAALVCLIFQLLGGVGVWAAVRIAGGAHAELTRFRSQGWSGNQSSNNETNNNSSGDSSDAVPSLSGGPGGGSGSTHGLPPQYAFQRTVGAAQ